MGTPVVSVHMPVYNAERYVGEAVESILAQTFETFEFIIIDDGSTDGSLEILRRHEEQDKRIRLVSRPNAGVGRTRNEALAMAVGKYFAAMDADDVSSPRRFARQVEYLERTPECVAVGSRVLLIDSDGAPIREWSPFLTHEEIDREHLQGRGGAITHPAAMMRREAVCELGGYRESLQPAEDYDLFLRLGEVGRLANLEDTLLHYRQHPTSFGYADRARQRKAAQTALREAYERRGLAISVSGNGAVEQPLSLSDHHRKWAWWALQAGNVATARKHALKALRLSPLSGQSWRAMACAVRGH